MKWLVWEYEREVGYAITPGNKFVSIVYTDIDITITKQKC